MFWIFHLRISLSPASRFHNCKYNWLNNLISITHISSQTLPDHKLTPYQVWRHTQKQSWNLLPSVIAHSIPLFHITHALWLPLWLPSTRLIFRILLIKCGEVTYQLMLCSRLVIIVKDEYTFGHSYSIQDVAFPLRNYQVLYWFWHQKKKKKHIRQWKIHIRLSQQPYKYE